MSLSLQIVPFEHSLDLFGDPDPFSAYSLSGHVVISLHPSSSFVRRRLSRLLLHSLLITFEGQSELICPRIPYVPTRLCSITRELAPSHPLELTIDDHDRCTWNVVFDLPIPGWLPASTTFGLDDDTGIRYGLYVTAKFLNIDDSMSSSFLSFICSPFRSSTRTVLAHKPITLKRFMNIPSSSPSFPLVNYTLQTRPIDDSPGHDSLKIPSDVLSNIHIVASVPDYVSVDENTIPFSIRIRATDMDEYYRKRLRVTGFFVQLNQTETYRSGPSQEYSTRYPVPPESSQPPNVPLINPHVLSTIGDLGLFPWSEHVSFSRSFSLLPDGQSGHYSNSHTNSLVFDHDTHSLSELPWFTMDTLLPFVHRSNLRDSRWIGGKLRLSGPSPLFCVTHELVLSITYSLDIPDSEEKAYAVRQFSIPLRFVRVAPPPPPLVPLTHLSAHPVVNTQPHGESYARGLPAYSQLFDSNGDRKIDYSVPLPLYSPTTPSSSSSASTLDLDYIGGETKPFIPAYLD